jgi:hypothetical protein
MPAPSRPTDGSSSEAVQFSACDFEASRERRSTILLFASVPLLPQTNETSLASSSTNAKRRPQRSLFFTSLCRPPLIVLAPPDMPALPETLLDVRAISPYFDRTVGSLERLAHCGQFHSILCCLHGASHKLLRTAVPFDQRRPSSAASDPLGVTTAVRPNKRLHGSQYSWPRAASLGRHSRALAHARLTCFSIAATVRSCHVARG